MVLVYPRVPIPLHIPHGPEYCSLRSWHQTGCFPKGKEGARRREEGFSDLECSYTGRDAVRTHTWEEVRLDLSD